MASTMPLLDRVIFDTVGEAEESVEAILNCDMLYYYGELRTGNFTSFRDSIERLFAPLTNGALGFPGIVRGALDVRAKTITDEMGIAAARELA